MPPKRARTDTPASRKRGRGLSALKKAQIASYKFNKLHPWSTWGAARLKRGEPGTRALFGPTYKTATAEQRSNRKIHGWKGKGGFWQDLESAGNRFFKAVSPYTMPIAKAASDLAVRKLSGISKNCHNFFNNDK